MIQNSKYEKFKDNDFISIVKRDPFEVMVNIFGQRYLEYRENWNAINEESIRPQFPLHIDVDLQDSCNQRCVMCHQSYRQRNDAVMTWTLLKQIIDEGSAMGLCALNFGSSAEPLLQKNLLIKGIAYANKKQIMDIFLHTNAILLSPTFAHMLIDSGLRHICISIDAFTKETYKKTRGSNSYERIVKNVLDFVEIRERNNKPLPTVRVSFCVNPSNYTERIMFQEYWRDKVDIIELQNYRHVGEIPVDNEFEKTKQKCDNPFKRLMIWPEGDLSLCCGYRSQDVTLGNVLDNSISFLWNGSKMNRIQDAFEGCGQLPTTCKTCLNSNYKTRG